MSADRKTRQQAVAMAAKLLNSRPDAFIDPQLTKWVDVLLCYEMTGDKVAHVDKYETSMQAWDWIEGKDSPLSAFE